MTGYGDACRERDAIRVSVELRTINSRHFKLVIRAPEGYASLEPKIEAAIRKHVRRATVHAVIKVERASQENQHALNLETLTAYFRQIERWLETHKLPKDVPPPLEALLLMPGVVEEKGGATSTVAESWPVIEDTLGAALAKLGEMRIREGAAMQQELAAHCQTIEEQREKIEHRAPRVVDNYRERLTEKMQTILAEHEVTVEAADLLREVGIFAERSDVAEELMRLASHLEQFQRIMEQEAGAGRKLEFVVQEMFRETNTIGSKANDYDISRRVVEMKAAIERIRELIQNVE